MSKTAAKLVRKQLVKFAGKKITKVALGTLMGAAIAGPAGGLVGFVCGFCADADEAH